MFITAQTSVGWISPSNTEGQLAMGMESVRFQFSSHIFIGFIAGLPRYMQTPRAYTSVTTVRHSYTIYNFCLQSFSQ